MGGKELLQLRDIARDREGVVGVGEDGVVLVLEAVRSVGERKISGYLPEKCPLGVYALVLVLVLAGYRLGKRDTVCRNDGAARLHELSDDVARVVGVVVERGRVEHLKVIQLDEQHHDEHYRPYPNGPYSRVHVGHRLITPVSGRAAAPSLSCAKAGELAPAARSAASACSVALSLEMRSKIASRM